MWDIGYLSIFLPTVMAVSLGLTLVIEVVMGLLMGVRKFKNILNIILANLITNPLLVSVTYYVGIMYSDITNYITLGVLEVLAVITEGLLYKKYLKYDKIKPLALSLILNITSFAIVSIVNLVIY